MFTAVPPPCPPQPPKYVPKHPRPTPSKPTVHGPYNDKTLQLIRDNHEGGVQYFVDGVLNRRAMYRFAVQQPKKNPLRVWQEEMRISRSHFLSRDEQHAAVVLEILCATPKQPRIPKPPQRPLPRPLAPPPASDQVTLTHDSRHRRSSLLPLAPAPKRPCPTPQFCSLLLSECLFFFRAIKPRHRVRVGPGRPFILMSLPPTTGDHLDTMFPTCTDLVSTIDGHYFSGTANATVTALGHIDTLINEYWAFADTVFYATTESPRTPPQYNGVYGAGMDSSEYAYGFTLSNYSPAPAPLTTSTYILSSAVPELWFCSSGGVCVCMRVCSEPLYL